MLAYSCFFLLQLQPLSRKTIAKDENDEAPDVLVIIIERVENLASNFAYKYTRYRVYPGGVAP